MHEIVEGVTILSEITTINPAFVIPIMMLIVGAPIFIISAAYDKVATGFLGIALILFSAVIGLVINPPAEISRIEAIVSPGASWVEISEQYELIEQRGQIYVFENRQRKEDKANEQNHACEVCGKVCGK